jgi:hypothetical protein
VTSGEIIAEAYAVFEAWLQSQPDKVQEMGLLDQITLYGGVTTGAVE